MLLQTLRRFSTNKFFDIIAKQTAPIIPDSPEDTILSKYITQKEEKKNSKMGEGFIKWQKEQIKKPTYKQFLQTNPYGSVLSFIHKNHQITLISVNYNRTQQKYVHKLLFQASPSAIVIQRRPDYYVRGFNLLPKGQDGVFSDSLYLKQLQFSAQSIRQEAKSSSPLTNAYNLTRDDVLEKNVQKEILQNKGFNSCVKYISSYTTPAFFGEMPSRSYRQWIANSHTLMELQQIFKNVCRRLPRYKNLQFTPYKMATLLYPENFLKPSDKYMSSLIQTLIAQKKHKKIVALLGIGQNQAIKQNLQNSQSLDPIINYLVPPGPKGNIVRDIESLQVIEKHILLDIFFEGKSILEVKQKFLHTTNSIIKKYGQDIEKEVLMKFRFDKTMQYVNLMDQKIRDGEKEIQKQFVRETLRDTKI